ncbi:DUF2807 domain-containing protein [Sphingorhabdus sp. Alg239-R122]|uniref:GIN domain-containing protein n=1 Tax=Sphingorhabdus sp. Alg239-R122 TaxID=2305989 RepID=UPI0013DAE6A3|nr:DUF2807 domain-containing protein [Sphingorhabdus sp. Alg239-R122]
MAFLRLIILLALLAPGMAAANPQTRSFTLANFDAVRVEGSMVVLIETGKPQSVRAEGELVDINQLDLRIENRTLIVKTRKKKSIDDDPGALLRVNARNVDDVTLTGKGRMVVNALTGRKTRASLYGIGELIVGNMDAEEMQLNFNGLGGRMQVAGRAENVKAIIRGKGVLDAAALNSETLEILGEGPVKSQFSASESAHVIISQFAQILINGDTRCNVRARNAAKVICGGKTYD